jgi:hypothetical protein
MIQRYTQNSSENENFSNIENILATMTTASSNPYNNAYIQDSTFGYSTSSNPYDNTHIQDSTFGYSTNMYSVPYNEYRKDIEEILEMFTEATKKLSENELKLIKNKFYDLFLNKKIKLSIEINDEEKI